MKKIKVLNLTTGSVIGDRIQDASTARTRLVGLLGKDGLPAGGGVWINPSSGIHTFGMKFAIDVVGLDRKQRVVRLWRNVRPQRLTRVDLRVRSVIELAAGEIEAQSISLGHTLKACHPDEAQD
jgi:uncharacterized protein